MGLALALLGFAWWYSWSVFVVTPYLSLCICHLPKRHMMSTCVWVSSVFIFLIVWAWQFYPLAFALFYSAENKHIYAYGMGQLTNTRRSDGAPDPDVVFKEVVRIKISHWRNLYLNLPDPIAFLPLSVDTTGRMYHEFIRLIFLHSHREASVLANELSEESDQFHFLHAVSLIWRIRSVW